MAFFKAYQNSQLHHFCALRLLTGKIRLLEHKHCSTATEDVAVKRATK